MIAPGHECHQPGIVMPARPPTPDLGLRAGIGSNGPEKEAGALTNHLVRESRRNCAKVDF